MKIILQLLCIIFSLLSPQLVFGKSPIQVPVGGYDYPPYVMVTQFGNSGLTIELLKEMNRVQKKYQFDFVLTNSPRRYQEFDSKKFDVIFFESRDWGWNDRAITATQTVLNDGDVFIARVAPNRGQEYFQSFEGKKIGAIVGYHYRFADDVVDQNVLRKKFNIEFAISQEKLIHRVLRGTIDLAIVTRNYLLELYERDSKLNEQILASQFNDRDYELPVLVRENGAISVAEMNRIIRLVKSNPNGQRLLKKFQSTKPTGLNRATKK